MNIDQKLIETILIGYTLPSAFLWTVHGYCSYIDFLVVVDDLLPHVHTQTLQTEDTLEHTFGEQKKGVG